MKKISIILPVYNVENYLDKCLTSLVNQTYQNLEIILVNDGSPDNSGEVCENWAKKDSRIKVLHKANGGVSSARNFGLDNATGDFIGFIDPDDFVELDMYEKLLNALNSQNATMAMCRYQNVFENSDRIQKV
ncbi:MAG: glycosyltransferase, partial [Clostridia bacterium]|nr:glycosyltransferase [Clostridia bacterium]